MMKAPKIAAFEIKSLLNVSKVLLKPILNEWIFPLISLPDNLFVEWLAGEGHFQRLHL